MASIRLNCSMIIAFYGDRNREWMPTGSSREFHRQPTNNFARFGHPVRKIIPAENPFQLSVLNESKTFRLLSPGPTCQSADGGSGYFNWGRSGGCYFECQQRRFL